MAGQVVFGVRFATDFHLGSGDGVPGLVDAALDRDSDGLPLLRGRRLKGLTRDGIRRALGALGERFPEEHPVAIRVLGRPSADPEAVGKAWASGVRSSDAGRFHFLDARVPRPPHLDVRVYRTLLAQRRAHVALDPSRGVASTDHLFTQEVATRHLRLVGRVAWDHPGTDDEIALLCVGLRMIETLGLRRTRGRGTCLLEVDGLYDAHWDQIGDPPRGRLRDAEALYRLMDRFVDDFAPVVHA